MARPRMPYQCLEKCGKYLVAASGSHIDLFGLDDGSYFSRWTCPSLQGSENANGIAGETGAEFAHQDSRSSSFDIKVDATSPSSPPAKRRKLSQTGDEKTELGLPNESNELVEDSKDRLGGGKKQKKQKQNSRSAAVASGFDAPAVIALTVTKSSGHVVAITGEDKNIRVFELMEADGVPRLNQLSQRQVARVN
ncbi:hypothetical protein G7Y89_g12262 [Cudoniella acicularis]|uniref:Uncharacterized protein n=1 Tax=Cudoniella acicularis TaxID=354080 RepID=A0A8H4RAS9_9HELO|nr:hypothetical protein G7Y89_g12262 [Cudoniella acicularis]